MHSERNGPYYGNAMMVRMLDGLLNPEESHSNGSFVSMGSYYLLMQIHTVSALGVSIQC
jgi:hypothetical protein